MNKATSPEDLLGHSDFLRKLSRSLLADEQSAFDVEQETWCTALEHPPKAGDLRGWLATVARNVARRSHRNNVRRGLREQLAARPEAQPAVHATVAHEETLARVTQAVLALEDPYRTTIFERYYEGLPPREIARRRGVPIETVRTQLKRALDKLRSKLDQDQQDWRRGLFLFAGKPLASTAGTWIASAVVLLLVVGVGAIGLWPSLRATVVSTALEPAIVNKPADAPAVNLAARTSGFTPSVGQREALPVDPFESHSLSGRVTDEQGKPVADVLVDVFGKEEDPFAGDDPAPRISSSFGSDDLYYGRRLKTDAEGRWHAAIPDGVQVQVRLGYSEAYEVVSSSTCGWPHKKGPFRGKLAS